MFVLLHNLPDARTAQRAKLKWPGGAARLPLVTALPATDEQLHIREVVDLRHESESFKRLALGSTLTLPGVSTVVRGVDV